MKIEIKLYGALKKYAPEARATFSMTLASNATVRDALTALNIPSEVQRIALLNGHRVADGVLIEPHSTLVLIPPISGG